MKWYSMWMVDGNKAKGDSLERLTGYLFNLCEHGIGLKDITVILRMRDVMNLLQVLRIRMLLNYYMMMEQGCYDLLYC